MSEHNKLMDAQQDKLSAPPEDLGVVQERVMTRADSEREADANAGNPWYPTDTKQELPALPKPIRSSEFWDDGIDRPLAAERAARMERECQLSEALAEVKNLSSRCESLQAEAERCLRDCGEHGAQAVMNENEISELRAELARERESREFWKSGWYALDKDNQDLRQVVREYRDMAYCGTLPECGGTRCTTCIKADALLAPKPAEGEN